MGTTSPVASSAVRKRLTCSSRAVSSLPNGNRSSSWNVMPYAPSSDSRSTASTGSSAGRVASPNGSRAVHPTVHRPKENLSSRVGSRLVIDVLSQWGRGRSDEPAQHGAARVSAVFPERAPKVSVSCAP